LNYLDKIVGDIEVHSVEGIKECFEHGVSPNDYYNNMPLIYELTSEYMRSFRFKDCVKAFVEYGLEFEDKLLLSVLLDDAATLEKLIITSPEGIHKRYTLRCAFTPLHEATLLHICAEFNHVSCAGILVDYGADINAIAGIDENGFGGQTPVFHTVNQVLNHSAGMLEFFLSRQANLHITVRGLIWGKGYPWETFIPAVNPISYAMMGLLPQMHRNEVVVSKTVSTLLRAGYGVDYKPPNVPNEYLRKQ
jgi:hypothetical protein